MAKLENTSFYVRNEFKEGLLMVKNMYENNEYSMLAVLTGIYKYAKDYSKEEEEKISLFKYLILYLKHLMEMDEKNSLEHELDYLIDIFGDTMEPDFIELVKEILEED